MTGKHSLPGRAALLAIAVFAAATTRAQDVLPAGEFVTHLEDVAHRQLFRGLGIDSRVIAALAQADFASAVESLSTGAAQGNQPFNIALIRLQHDCARIVQSPTTVNPAQLDKLRADLPEARATRIIAVLDAQNEYTRKAQASCRTARFDLRRIEAMLKQAAEQGDAVSATELARYTGDATRREAMLVAAAAKNYAPAQHALAQSRVVGVQRGLSTENVASIRILLKQAGQTLPLAKLDFANCVAVGCDGHPADAPTAAVFGVDAARDGEAAAFPAMMRMPWRQRLKPEELIAWQYFGDRLNESGCTGEGYIGAAINFTQMLGQLEKTVRPDVVTAGKQLAERYWTDFGDRAKKEQLCD
ncbi:MAG: hypothetical protein ABL964_05910 [Steroidobacteraceae bacterium]